MTYPGIGNGRVVRGVPFPRQGWRRLRVTDRSAGGGQPVGEIAPAMVQAEAGS